MGDDDAVTVATLPPELLALARALDALLTDLPADEGGDDESGGDESAEHEPVDEDDLEHKLDDDESDGAEKAAPGDVETKNKVASDAGAARYGLPIGTELGQARDKAAQQAQDAPGARDLYHKLMSMPAAQRAKFIAGLSDDDAEKLTRATYSTRTSNPDVVAARNLLATHLAKRGKDVRDFGALGGGPGKGKGGAGQGGGGKARTAGKARTTAPKKDKDPTWVGKEDWEARRLRRTKLGLMGKGNPPDARTKRGEGGAMMRLTTYADGSWQYKAAEGDGVQTTDTADEAEVKRQFTAAQREKAHTIPGTDAFPIESEQDLRNAIQAYGRAKDKAKAKAHIITQAKRLGLTKLLPDGWLSDTGKDAWDDVIEFTDGGGDVEEKRTTTPPSKTRKAQRAGATIGKDKSDDKDGGDEYPIKTVGDVAAAIKKAKAIKDPERLKIVRAHIRAGAAKINCSNMIPGDWSGGGGKDKGGKGKGSGKPWEKSADVDLSTMDPVELAALIEAKVMSPNPGATKLREYWAHGKGRNKWRPGTAGDFDRLRRHLAKYVPPHMLNGLTANIHRLATGKWPGPGHGPGRHKTGEPDDVEVKTTITAAALAEAAGLDPDAIGPADDDDAVTLALNHYAGMADEITSEEAYEQALADEIDWELLPDGTLERADGLDSTDDVNPEVDGDEEVAPGPDATLDALDELFAD